MNTDLHDHLDQALNGHAFRDTMTHQKFTVNNRLPVNPELGKMQKLDWQQLVGDKDAGHFYKIFTNHTKKFTKD